MHLRAMSYDVLRWQRNECGAEKLYTTWCVETAHGCRRRSITQRGREMKREGVLRCISKRLYVVTLRYSCLCHDDATHWQHPCSITLSAIINCMSHRLARISSKKV